MINKPETEIPGCPRVHEKEETPNRGASMDKDITALQVLFTET
jgi:hypothetical protein